MNSNPRGPEPDVGEGCVTQSQEQNRHRGQILPGNCSLLESRPHYVHVTHVSITRDYRLYVDTLEQRLD